ncbi:MAG: S8 family serine peptidase [Clostridiales bacterium]|nr:S8 family serine peptidase [Clostridiales bacterium]
MIKKVSLLIVVVLISAMLVYLPMQKTFALDMIEEQVEEKIFCKATLQDDFVDDAVIVVLNQNASFEFIDYVPEDFAEVNCEVIDDLTGYSTKVIKKYYNAEQSISALKSNIEKKTSINVENYHRILCLTLKDKSKANVLKTIKQLETRDDVLIAEPNYIGFACETLNDPLYHKEYHEKDQWGLHTEFGISAPEAWDITTGNSTILVGVMDSGIDGQHEDLKNRIYDNLHMDFLEDTPKSVNKNELIDLTGHGTEVAGIIGAQGNNRIGVTGVAWDVRLVSLRVSNEKEEWNSEWVQNAIDFAESKYTQKHFNH